MTEHHITVSRRARYYSLGRPPEARMLWIVLHGYGQLAAPFLEGFAGIATPERAVVAPEALNRFYKDGGAIAPHADTPIGTTWMTREFRQAEIADYVEYLDTVVQATRAPGSKVGVVGFSQGVATAVRWAAFGATPLDRVVLWAGQLPPDVDYAAVRQRFAGGIDLVQGTQDEYGRWIGLEAQGQRLQAAGIETRVTTFDGGHRIDSGALTAVVNR